jgi:hypothetical protein
VFSGSGLSGQSNGIGNGVSGKGAEVKRVDEHPKSKSKITITNYRGPSLNVIKLRDFRLKINDS